MIIGLKQMGHLYAADTKRLDFSLLDGVVYGSMSWLGPDGVLAIAFFNREGGVSE